MQDWLLESKKIQALDTAWRAKARERLRVQTRPEGSLGVLERLLERLVAIQKKDRPQIARKRILIFAADHGIAAEGVSLYPSDVTRAMVLNFLNGGATINALARGLAAEVRVVDVGVHGDFGADPRLIHAKVRASTRNMLDEPAMTVQEFDQALRTGWDLACAAREDGVELLALGEMGIANTTAASAVIAAITRAPVESVTGRGTGLGPEALAHKIRVIEKALQRHSDCLEDPIKALQCLGGFELAAMTGAMLGAARSGLGVVVDGWIVSASVLAAMRINPHVLDYLFFAHQSEEKGHRFILQAFEAEPILNLSMRLGEASGAALAMGILDAAVRVYNEVATFSEAGVSGRNA